jgi:hypothetical protein
MIRREIRFAGGEVYWLLIAQVEHARLSGVLAAQCLDQFGDCQGAAARNTLAAVRRELHAAIFHHDDGWNPWDESPRLDPHHHRPLSFLEFPLEDSLLIWSCSIGICERIGPLAAWIVAGHFSALLTTSEEHLANPVARDWLRDVARCRSNWFSAWHQQSPPSHTAELAAEALKWLQLFDVLSLWPCAEFPLPLEIDPPTPAPHQTSEDWLLVREIRLEDKSDRSVATPDSSPRIVFDPWPFARDPITLEAQAHLVPRNDYETAEHLLAARQPFLAQWSLYPPLSVGNSGTGF